MDGKRAFLIGIGWGVGTAFGLGLIVLGLYLHSLRPTPAPQNWNTSAIKADFDYVGTEDDGTVTFRYILDNTTDFDYHVARQESLVLAARLQRQNSLSVFHDDKAISFPIDVPAHKRVGITIRIPGYKYEAKIKVNRDSSTDERRRYHEEIERYISGHYTNLDGFDMLDKLNRYEVIFPAGWKEIDVTNPRN